MASSPEAVKEMLVQKSVEYAGRPQTYSVKRRTLGMLLLVYFNLFRDFSTCLVSEWLVMRILNFST